jgi:hypothetical protein
MSITFDKKLEDMIATLKSWNAWLVANGQGQSAQFLDMARLELQLILNKISDEELKALCDAVDQAKSSERILPGPVLTTFERLDTAENKRIMQLALVAQNGPVRKH